MRNWLKIAVIIIALMLINLLCYLLGGATAPAYGIIGFIIAVLAIAVIIT